MKYSIPIRPHGVRSPRPRSRVPGYTPIGHPSSPSTLTPRPRDLALTAITFVFSPSQPFHFPLYPTVGPLNVIQNP